MIKKLWRLWLKFAEKLGTVQMIVLLSVVYWTMVTVIAVPFKLLADPLRLRKPAKPVWIPRPAPSRSLEDMRRQY